MPYSVGAFIYDALVPVEQLWWMNRYEGVIIESPRYYRKAHHALEKAQQALSRKTRGSHRRKKAVKRVASLHRKVRNQRRDFHHKNARDLVQEHQVIVFEDVQLTNLVKHARPKQDETGKYLPNGAVAKSGLTKSILDYGWGTFVAIVMYKAEDRRNLVSPQKFG